MRTPLEPPPGSEPAPDEYDIPFGPLLEDEERCDDCGEVFARGELSEIDYGAGDEAETLHLCDGCFDGDYKTCYDCGRWFVTGRLVAIAPERLAEIYSPEELAAAERDGTGVDETICWRCDDIWDREHPRASA